MSDESKNTAKVIPAGVEVAAVPGDKPRFAPTNLQVEGYVGSRLRRWESYQKVTVKRGLLNRLQITSAADIESKLTDAHSRTVSHWLQTCLVGGPSASSPQLLCKGAGGIEKLNEDLTPSQIIATFKAAVELSEVFA